MTGDLLSLAGPAPAAVPRGGVPPGAADRARSDEAASGIGFESLVAGLTEVTPCAGNEEQGSAADAEATSLRTGPEISGIALGLVVPNPQPESPSPGGDEHDDQVEPEYVAIDVTDPELATPTDEACVPIEAAPVPLLPDPGHSRPTSWAPRDTDVGDAVSSPTATELALPRRGEAEPGADAAPGLPEGIPSTSPPAEPRAGDAASLNHETESAHPVKPPPAVAGRAGTAGDASAPRSPTPRHVDVPVSLTNSINDDRVARRETAADVNADEPGVWGRATPGERSDVERPRRTAAAFVFGQAPAGDGSGEDNEPTAWGAPLPAAQSPEAIGSGRAGRSQGHDSTSGGASRGTTTMDVAPAFLLAAVAGTLRGAALANYAPHTADSASAPAAEYGPFPGDPAQQVVKAVRLQWSEGIGEARLKLHPEHLGELSIKLRVEQGAVTASVRVDSAAAAEWIRANRAELESSLGAQGLALDTLEVVVDPDERRRQQSAPETSDDLPPPRRRRGDQPRFEIHV